MSRGHLVALALVLSAAAPAAQSPGSLEARVKRLEDREQIAQLLVDYGRHLDSRDLAAYAALFAEEGEWAGGFGTVKGRRNIQAFMEKSLGTDPNRGGSYHVMSNFVITVKGDTATAWSRWTFIVPGERGAAVSQAGRYDDTFIREKGAWKFQRRVASNDTAPPAPAGPR
ncbi:MAG: nuclear transport factor 2 family protein [Gemmatimonadetes bacterium]|nr:nuclear transport factor 2 family protein [Gemmatimonadota bacterium]